MGERFEVLVEVNDNKPFDLVTLLRSARWGWRLRRLISLIR